MGSSENQPLLVVLESPSSTSSTAIEELLENRKVTMRWWPRLIVWESRQLWILSWATITSSLFNYMLSFVTLMFAGHLGDVQLAGASLSCVALQGFVCGVMVRPLLCSNSRLHFFWAGICYVAYSTKIAVLVELHTPCNNQSIINIRA